MAANGDIYLSKYSGWYSVRDEAYFDESELTDGPDGKKLAPSGAPVEWVEEESYFFRLSAYADKLLAHYDAHPDFVTPEKYRNEIVAFVKRGLVRSLDQPRDPRLGRAGSRRPEACDVCLGRRADQLHHRDRLPRRRPAGEILAGRRHVIGKDITRFHAIYWPAFLMSAGLPVPKQVVVHGFLFNRGEKMSKSVGNVVDPKAMVEAYGLDPVRYFFLREVPFGQDGSYSHEAIVARMNADLANDIGNLAQRSLTMIAKNCGARTPDWRRAAPAKEDLAMLARADALIGEARRHMQSFALHLYIGAVFEVVAEANRYFANAEPWKLAKSDPARMGLVLYVTIETLRDRRDPAAAGDAGEHGRGFSTSSASRPRRARSRRWTPASARGQSRRAASARAGQGAAPARAGLSPLCRGGGGEVRAVGLGRRRMTIIDSHCHLDFPDFADDLDGVVERARAAGVERMITIGTKVSKAAGVVAIAERYDDVFFTVGTHPHEAAGEGAEDFDAMRAFASHPKCVGIGEAGLDYHYDNAPRDVARRVFRGQIALARELDLPLVIHTRDADDDMARDPGARKWGRGGSAPCSIASPPRASSPRPRSASGSRSRFPAW